MSEELLSRCNESYRLPRTDVFVDIRGVATVTKYKGYIDGDDFVILRCDVGTFPSVEAYEKYKNNSAE